MVGQVQPEAALTCLQTEAHVLGSAGRYQFPGKGGPEGAHCHLALGFHPEWTLGYTKALGVAG